MITTAFLLLALDLVTLIVSFFPASSGFPSNVISAASTLGGYFGMFSAIIPLGTLATAVAVVFIVEISIFGWKTVKSLVSHIPWIGGSGH